MMTLFQISCISYYLNLTLMRNLRWKRFWIQICIKDTLYDWLNESILMNLPDINFLISLSVMRLWNTSTTATWINQTKLTDVNNLLVWRTQSFYHESFLANSHTHNNMILYVISACHSAGKLHACIHDPSCGRMAEWYGVRASGIEPAGRRFEPGSNQLLFRLFSIIWKGY